MFETRGMTVIRVINNCMIALGIVLFAQGIYVNMTAKTVLIDLVICLDVVIMHFVLEYLRSFVPFTIGGVGLVLVNYLLIMPFIKAGSYDFIPVLVVAVGILFLTYYAHINDSVMIKPNYWLLVSCGFYLLFATFTKSQITLTFGEIYTVCVIIFSFVYMVLYRQDRRLRLSSDRTYVPADRIKSSNFILMASGSGIVAFLGIAFIIIGHGEKLIYAVWNAILNFLRYLFSGMNYEYEEEVSVDAAPGGSPISFGDLVDQKENPFLEKFWETLSMVMSVAAVFFVIFVLVALVIHFYKSFQRTAAVRERDKVEYLKPDESVSLTKETRSSHLSIIDRSPRARIRKRYKKFIKKAPFFKDVETQMTPEEIENAAYKDTDLHNLRAIHEIYEKARYDSSSINTKDAADFEKLFRA